MTDLVPFSVGHFNGSINCPLFRFIQVHCPFGVACGLVFKSLLRLLKFLIEHFFWQFLA